MKIEAGKRYIRRDGTISPALQPWNIKGDENSKFHFSDGYQLYTKEGEFWTFGQESLLDLIKEYEEFKSTLTDMIFIKLEEMRSTGKDFDSSVEKLYQEVLDIALEWRSTLNNERDENV